MNTGLGLGSYFARKTPASLKNGIVIQNNIFVSKNGNDTTGQRERLDLPFLTISAAAAIATAGDTIYIFAGVYDENDIGVGNVNYYFENGAKIEYTGTNAQYIFRFTAGTSIIDGFGEFIVTSASSGNGVLNTSGTGTNVTIKAKNLEAQNVAKYCVRCQAISICTLDVTTTKGGIISSEVTNSAVGIFGVIGLCQSKLATSNIGNLYLRLTVGHIGTNSGIYSIDYGFFGDSTGQVYIEALGITGQRANPGTTDGFYHFERSAKYFISVATKFGSSSAGPNAPLLSTRNELAGLQCNFEGFYLNESAGASAYVGHFAQTNNIVNAVNNMSIKFKKFDGRAQGGTVVNTFITTGANTCDTKWEPGFINLANAAGIVNIVGAPTVNAVV